MELAREDKPAWSVVPRSVKDEVERILGCRVKRATRTYGGYAPSATFLLALDDGSRAFFKGTFPTPPGSGVEWMLDEEERVYQELAHLIAPWAPTYLGSVRSEGWHALLLEALSGERVPPWSDSQARRAARSYGQFHASTHETRLPAWLPAGQHIEFADYWTSIASDPAARSRLAALAGERRRDAARWLASHAGRLAAESQMMHRTPPTQALLHFDTRSDNVRLQGDRLRLFDWPFACIGPPEVDLAAFAQSIAAEGGPQAERIVDWYSEVAKVDRQVLSASVAAISGYFADRAPREPVPGLPRLRTVQQSQLRSSLTWAARLLELPEPGWLNSIGQTEN